MEPLVYDAPDEQATRTLGTVLAEVLPNGTTVALCGTLGAGKTRLVQAIAAASGVDPRLVASPTFVLIHEYQGRRPVYHLDAHRIADADEFLALGPDEYFEGDGLALVEWADRVEACLPRERIEIHIELAGPQSRRFEIRSTGARLDPIVQRLRQSLAQCHPQGL